MLPTISQGDRVIYRPVDPSKFSPNQGSIVVVKDPLDPNSLLVKRVYKKSLLGLELRGDNELNSVDSRKFGLVSHSSLCGVVEQIFPQAN